MQKESSCGSVGCVWLKVQKWLWSQTWSQSCKLFTLCPCQCLHCSRANKPVLQSLPPGKVGNPSSAHLSVVAHGDMDKRQRIHKALADPHEPQNHQTWGAMEFMDDLMLKDDTAIVDHVERCNQVSGLLWVGSLWVQSLSCAWLRPLRPSWNVGQLGTLCELREMEFNNLLSCSSEE